MDTSLNVHGQTLEPCSVDPLTGWYRDGCCNTDEHDRGLHTVCCIVNEAFLNFAKEAGNDLMTPAPQFNFPGLKPGNQWCVCAATWRTPLFFEIEDIEPKRRANERACSAGVGTMAGNC